MAFAESNRASLKYLAEDSDAWGVTPSTGSPRTMRIKSSSLSYKKDTKTSDELRSDRMIPNIIEVGASSEGDVDGEFSAGAYDDFLAAFLYGSWSRPMTFDVWKGPQVSIVANNQIRITGLGDLTAYFTTNRFIKTEGFVKKANNSYWTISSVATAGGNTTITISETSMVVEAGTAYTKVMDANDVIVFKSTAIRFGTASAATIDSNGGNLFASAITAEQLKVGQKIHVDGLGFDSGSVAFAGAAPAAGDTVTINDTEKQAIFQFGGTLLPGNIEVTSGADSLSAATAFDIAIRTAAAAGKLNVTSSLGSTTSAVAASGTLTSEGGGGSGQPSNNETVIIGIKTYTFETSLTDVDGHVKIGATVALSLANLKNAINGSGGTIGTDYATSTTPNTQVTAVSDATSVTVTAILAGTAGNAIGTTGTYPASDDSSWGAATLTGGVNAAGTVTIYNLEAEDGSIVEDEAGSILTVTNFSGGEDDIRGFFTIVSLANDSLGVDPAPPTVSNGSKAVTIKACMLRNPSVVADFIPQSFTIETAFEDVEEYFLGTGLKVSTFQMEVQAGEIVTFNLSFMGRAMERRIDGTSLLGESPYTPLDATGNEIMNATTNVGNLTKNGEELATALKSITLKGDASLRPQMCVGSKFARGIGVGRFQLTGSFSAYFETGEMFDDFVAHTTTSLGWSFTDIDGNTYFVLIPAIKMTSDPVAPSGIDTDVMEDIEWEAQRDPSLNCMFQMDRFSSINAPTAVA